MNARFPSPWKQPIHYDAWAYPRTDPRFHDLQVSSSSSEAVLPATGDMTYNATYTFPADLNVTTLPDPGQKVWVTAKLNCSTSTAFSTDSVWQWTVDVSELADAAILLTAHASVADQYVRTWVLTAYGVLKKLTPQTKVKVTLKMRVANQPDSYDDTMDFVFGVSLFGYSVRATLTSELVDLEKFKPIERRVNTGDPLWDIRYLYDKRGVFTVFAFGEEQPDFEFL